MLAEAIRTVHGGKSVLSPGDLATLLEGEFQSRHTLPVAFETLDRQGA